jgi:hypothetical protein
MVRGNPFRKGRDLRRHRLTTEERRRGFERTFNRAMYEAPWLLLWLWLAIDTCLDDELPALLASAGENGHKRLKAKV